MKTKKELVDLIDLNLWKSLQDSFAQAIKLPVVTIDPSGKIVHSSRDFPFFCQLVEHTETGSTACTACRKKHFELLKESPDGLLFYYCHADLLNVMVPIKVNNEIVGAVICESILRTKKTVPICRKTSELTKIPTVELIDAITNLRLLNTEDVENYAKVLVILSQTIPELVHQKVASDQKISELTLLHGVSKTLSSTLELDKMIDYIMNYMLSASKAMGCSIIINDGMKKRFEIGKNLEKYKNFEQGVVDEVLKTNKHVIIPNIATASFSEDPDYDNSNSNSDSSIHSADSDASSDTLSIIAIPMTIKSKIIGTINLYGAPIDKMTDHDLNFLKIITNQTAMAVQNSQQYEQIKELAITDKLTSLYNRRHFEKLTDTEIERSKRYSHPISVALLDIDHFGNYNNTHGHPKGDVLLEKFAGILRENTRKIDILGRYGGEEFIIVMPNTTPEEAFQVTDRIRYSIENYEFFGREKQPLGRVTASIGVVTNYDYSNNRADLIKAADDALYSAKDSGRNKVISVVIESKNSLENQDLDDFVFKDPEPDNSEDSSSDVY